MAKSGEFVSGGRFVHAQPFTGPVLEVFSGARVTRQPQTTNAIRTARKVASSRLSDDFKLRHYQVSSIVQGGGKRRAGTWSVVALRSGVRQFCSADADYDDNVQNLSHFQD
jgi:hypothetical protein